MRNSITNGKNQIECVETQDEIKDDIYDVMIQRCKQKYSTDVRIGSRFSPLGDKEHGDFRGAISLHALQRKHRAVFLLVSVPLDLRPGRRESERRLDGLGSLPSGEKQPRSVLDGHGLVHDL